MLKVFFFFFFFFFFFATIIIVIIIIIIIQKNKTSVYEKRLCSSWLVENGKPYFLLK